MAKRRRSIRGAFWRQRRGNPSGMWVAATSRGPGAKSGAAFPAQRRRTGLRQLRSNGLEMGLTYQDAGVSIDAGNALVKAIGPLARSTARPGADAELGGFGGLFD